MIYRKTVVLKDGRSCLLRNASAEDSQAVLDEFIRTHAETDFLLTYPDETTFTVEEEARFLQGKADSADEVYIVAVLDGKIVGTAGVDKVGQRDKIKHRAEFGISILKECWGLGIGRALTKGCIECATAAGYVQPELEAVADNAAALSLYESVGFREYGRNPKGFLTRGGAWQELVLMRLELT